jgi:hypothetical protein
MGQASLDLFSGMVHFGFPPIGAVRGTSLGSDSGFGIELTSVAREAGICCDKMSLTNWACGMPRPPLLQYPAVICHLATLAETGVDPLFHG